jgi:hypothetical protein
MSHLTKTVNDLRFVLYCQEELVLETDNERANTDHSITLMVI